MPGRGSFRSCAPGLGVGVSEEAQGLVRASTCVTLPFTRGSHPVILPPRTAPGAVFHRFPLPTDPRDPRPMSNFIGKAAPAFSAEAVMPDGSTQSVSLSDYSGQYVALFFYPKDFTFV